MSPLFEPVFPLWKIDLIKKALTPIFKFFRNLKFTIKIDCSLAQFYQSDMGNESEFQSEPQSTIPKAGIFKKIFHHPNFNVVCGIVTIISLIFGVWSWYVNIKERNLTYYISPTRTPIVQKGSLDNFSVTFHGIQITNDLSSAEILIWNQGKLPIHKEEILKTITLKTVNGEPIYQTTAKPSRDVIGFNPINLNVTNTQQGVFQFDWKILEHNDGIRLQIIHGGNVNVPITVEGVVEGQPKGITQFQNQNDTKTTSYRINKILNGLLMGSGALCLILTIKYTGDYLEEYAKRITSPISGWLMLVAYSLFCVLVMAFFIVSFLYLSKPPKPPFGF
jgi:hypothetical protein